MKLKHLLVVVGARPQFIKMATLIVAQKKLGSKSGIRITWVNTGQHYDPRLSNEIFDDLNIPEAKYSFDMGKSTPANQLARIITELQPVFKKEKPDCLVVFGDTTSTLAGALAGHLQGVPVAHIEAGLRSYDKRMPEESNRIITDSISKFLFCPTNTAIQNLKKESSDGELYQVGDVMADILYHTVRKHSLKRKDLNYYLVTIHRNTNTDDPKQLLAILKALGGLDKEVKLLMHPRTAAVIKRDTKFSRLIKSKKKIRVLKPVNYTNMLKLQIESTAVITDSGGLQKEAFLLNVPCVTLRQSTEWVETVKLGRNSLCEAHSKEIIDSITKQKKVCLRKPHKIYGNGDAAVRVLKVLRRVL